MLPLVLLASLVTGEPAAAVPDQSFTLVLPVSPETDEGRRLIAARASEICGARYPRLGRYAFSGSETLAGPDDAPPRFEVRQELACLDAPLPSRQVEPAPADWKPSAADERRVWELTRHLFALVDEGKAAEVHALWSAENQDMMPLAERADALRRFREQAGRPGPHRIAKLTWYVNPPAALSPGVYVAVDYERSYSALLFHCGYLVWFRDASGRYVLVREESAVLARNDAKDLTGERLAEMRAAMRCPGP